MKKIKLFLFSLFFGSIAVGCNSDADDLGLQFFENNEAKGEQAAYDLVAYNVNNNDVVRSDSYSLKKTTLGAFTEGQFGMQKSAYVTQVRLSKYAPDFGTNPVVDSVVLEIKPEYDATAKTTSTTNITYKGQAAKQTLTKYEAVKYGNPATTMNIDVHEITTDLGAVGTEILSNSTVATSGVPLGTKAFSGNVYAVSINKTSDNTVLLTREAGVRIKLDKVHFQTKIANKSGASELSNESNFINYFKGLKISIQENDGYLINFAPDQVTMTMYYTYGDASDRKEGTYSFNLASPNVHFSQISYNRNTIFNNVMASIDRTNGDPLLYMQGMGGPGAGIKIPENAIEALKTLRRDKRAAIVSAKIRLYTDTSAWNNSYTKPDNFLVKKEGETDFIADIKAMLYNNNFKLVTAYATNANPSYYDVNITKTVKDIVEQGQEAKDIILNIGSYLTNYNGALVSEDYNTNVYSPNRAVFVGTNSVSQYRPRLLITYIIK
jgi:hypothetical protein